MGNYCHCCGDNLKGGKEKEYTIPPDIIQKIKKKEKLNAKLVLNIHQIIKLQSAIRMLLVKKKFKILKHSKTKIINQSIKVKDSDLNLNGKKYQNTEKNLSQLKDNEINTNKIEKNKISPKLTFKELSQQTEEKKYECD